MWHSDDEAGITLVEIMLSLLLLGIVLTAFFAVITNSLRSLSDSRLRQTASQVSTELIEDLRVLSPSEIAMYNDPNDGVGGDFDATTVSCGGNTGSFDPDGDGPLGCETIVVDTFGAVTAAAPWQTTTTDGVTITTIATEVDDVDVPAGTVRVTVVADYTLPNGSEQIRRSALFSEVPRG